VVPAPKRQMPSPVVVKSTPAAGEVSAAAASPGTKPATMTAARDGTPDDLKQIKGVGPKLEELLHSMGFYHYDQIAAWTADEVAWVDENLEGFKGRVSRDDWVGQAKSLTLAAD
jgi:NADH-quinone oxidoreductase subunit E